MTVSPTGRRPEFFFASPDRLNAVRDPVAIIAGAALDIGTVLGKITKGTPIAAADPGNVGDGAMGEITLGQFAEVGEYSLRCISESASIPGEATPAAYAGNAADTGTIATAAVGAGAKVGVYRVTCIESATDAGTFTVEDPDGVEIGVATVGVEFVGGGLTFTIADGTADFTAGEGFTITVAELPGNGGVFAVFGPRGYRLADLTVGQAYTGSHLNMTLADGDTDFEVGDVFTVTVPTGSGKFTALAPAAVDGSQVAAAILGYSVDASEADSESSAVARFCEVLDSALIWPAGITADQKAAAVAQLATLGIMVR